MGVSQKEWNSKARAAGRKASAKARKQGASTKQITSAYRKAYSKIRGKSPARKRYEKSPARKLSNIRSQQRWRKTPAGKLQWQRWNKSPAGRCSRQRENSKTSLRKALQVKGPILNGWPDAGRIELKIGMDEVRASQWRRAAQAYVKGIVFKLLFAATHEDAAYTKKYKTISFEEYANQIGMLKEWNTLIGKVKNLSKE